MLETTFYALGIVCMIVYLILVTIMVMAYFRTKQNIEEFRETMYDRFAYLIRDKNSEMLTALGVTIATLIVERIKVTLGMGTTTEMKK